MFTDDRLMTIFQIGSAVQAAAVQLDEPDSLHVVDFSDGDDNRGARDAEQKGNLHDFSDQSVSDATALQQIQSLHKKAGLHVPVTALEPQMLTEQGQVATPVHAVLSGDLIAEFNAFKHEK